MSRRFAGEPLRAGPLAQEPPVIPAEAGSAVAETLHARLRPHLPWLAKALRRRVGHDRAEDLVQETYVRVIQSQGLGAPQTPRALLLTVAMNLARDQFRRERVRNDHAARMAHPLPQAGAGAPSVEDDLQVRQIILGLPPNLRDVLLLSKVGGLTNREIAQRYGLSVRAIDKRLHKAIMLFVARLRD